ncbi:hypothetical protein DICA3_C03488 [Diutina catenulata]
MILIDGVKYSCLSCIRGHRSTSCTHHQERPLAKVNGKGRPTQDASLNSDHRVVVFAEVVSSDPDSPNVVNVTKYSAKKLLDVRTNQVIGDYVEALSPQKARPLISGDSFINTSCGCSLTGRVQKSCGCNSRNVNKKKILQKYLEKKAKKVRPTPVATPAPSMPDFDPSMLSDMLQMVEHPCSCDDSCMCPGCQVHNIPLEPLSFDMGGQWDANHSASAGASFAQPDPMAMTASMGSLGMGNVPVNGVSGGGVPLNGAVNGVPNSGAGSGVPINSVNGVTNGTPYANGNGYHGSNGFDYSGNYPPLTPAPSHNSFHRPYDNGYATPSTRADAYPALSNRQFGVDYPSTFDSLTEPTSETASTPPCSCPPDSCDCTNCETHGNINGFKLDDLFGMAGPSTSIDALYMQIPAALSENIKTCQSQSSCCKTEPKPEPTGCCSKPPPKKSCCSRKS